MCDLSCRTQPVIPNDSEESLLGEVGIPRHVVPRNDKDSRNDKDDRLPEQNDLVVTVYPGHDLAVALVAQTKLDSL